MGSFLLVLLVLLSYHTMTYDQMGLPRSVTGVVDYNNVLPPQSFRYLPITKTPKKFPATLQRVAFLAQEGTALVVFAEGGFEFDFDIEFHYLLNMDGLGALYRMYGTNYHDRVRTRAQSVVKDAAVAFSSDQYIRNRDVITRNFSGTLKSELESAMPITIAVEFVIMEQINFPDTLKQKNLGSALAILNTSLQMNQQVVDVIESTTDALVASILAEANFTLSNATIAGNQTLSDAAIQSNQLQLVANAEGLKYAISTLNLNALETHALLKAMAFRKSTQSKVLYGGSFTPLIKM